MRASLSALVAVALAAVTAGCGSGDTTTGGGGVRWTKAPVVFAHATLRRDRVLQGEIRNATLERVRIGAGDLKLLDADGDRVPGVAIFLDGFLHGNFPPTREPELDDSELERLGRLARIAPGETVPLTVAWRESPGADPPVRLSWGRGFLPIPQAAALLRVR